MAYFKMLWQIGFAIAVGFFELYEDVFWAMGE